MVCPQSSRSSGAPLGPWSFNTGWARPTTLLQSGGILPAKSNRIKASHRNARGLNLQHSWVEISARHDDLRLFGAVESSFQTEPQGQQARKQLTAPHRGKDFSMSSVEGVRIGLYGKFGLVDDSRTVQAVCSAGRAAELNNSHAPLESNTALASATQSSSF